jgi:hypothetical protein
MGMDPDISTFELLRDDFPRLACLAVFCPFRPTISSIAHPIPEMSDLSSYFRAMLICDLRHMEISDIS